MLPVVGAPPSTGDITAPVRPLLPPRSRAGLGILAGLGSLADQEGLGNQEGPGSQEGPGRVGLGRVGLGRVGLGRVGLGRVGLGRVGLGRVAGLARDQFSRLTADPRLPAWLRRALACAAVGTAFGVAVDWRLGVAGAVVTAAVGMLFSMRTSAVVPAAARATSARRRTRHRLSRLAPAGYLTLRDRLIADPGATGGTAPGGTATGGTATGEVTAGEVTAGGTATGEVTTGEVTTGEVTAGGMTAGGMTGGATAADETLAGGTTGNATTGTGTTGNSTASNSTAASTTATAALATAALATAGHATAVSATAISATAGHDMAGHDMAGHDMAELVAEHLVAGPAGVFVIGSVHWDRRLPVRTARRGRLFHGPFDETAGLERLARQAEHAGRQISEAMGRVVPVRPALVIYGPQVPWPVMTIAAVDVLPGHRLRWYLRRESSAHRAARLTERQAEIVHSVANQIFPPGRRPGPRSRTAAAPPVR